MISRTVASFNRERTVHPKCVVAALAMAAPVYLLAGEISGLPPEMPPRESGPLTFSYTNDLLGAGTVDDFRTGQFTISGDIGDRWVFAIDHSILTLIDSANPERTDQLSASLGRRLVNRQRDAATTRLAVGLGARASGEIFGERLQNGSHQLVGSSIEIAPYADLDRTEAIAWVDAQHYSLYIAGQEPQDWQFGYWLQGSALGTSAGALDAAAGAYAVVRRGALDIWVGLRQDWRTGYDEPILAAVADEEQDVAAVLGLHWGPVAFESVQQFDHKASYGQIRVSAAGFDASRSSSRGAAFTLGGEFTAPDVFFNLTGRYRGAWLNHGVSDWRRNLFVTAGYGEPQHGDDPLLYRHTIQAGAGIEWQRPLGIRDGWAGLWLSLGAGWREERIFGDAARNGEQSPTVSGVAALAGAGLQFDGGELFGGYFFRVRLGIGGSFPFGSETVAMGDDVFEVQQPVVTFTLGLLLGRFDG